MEEIAKELFGKSSKELDDKQTYTSLLALTKRLMSVSKEISGEKKVYYISAEFLIGKLCAQIAFHGGAVYLGILCGRAAEP